MVYLINYFSELCRLLLSKKAALSYLFAFSLFILAGCHGGRIPLATDWKMAPVAEGYETETKPTRPTMRIVAAFDWSGDHISLWVGNRRYGWIIWDPGSWFTDHPMYDGYTRKKDLIIDRIPSLQTYWNWRLLDLGILAMLAFEWDISLHESERLYSILTDGSYDTDHLPATCGVAMSKFLNSYTSFAVPGLPASIQPLAIADKLWEYNPSRVVVMLKDKPTLVYFPKKDKQISETETTYSHHSVQKSVRAVLKENLKN